MRMMGGKLLLAPIALVVMVVGFFYKTDYIITTISARSPTSTRRPAAWPTTTSPNTTVSPRNLKGKMVTLSSNGGISFYAPYFANSTVSTPTYQTRPYQTRPYPTQRYPTRRYQIRPYQTRFYPTRPYPTRRYQIRPYQTRFYPTSRNLNQRYPPWPYPIWPSPTSPYPTSYDPIGPIPIWPSTEPYPTRPYPTHPYPTRPYPTRPYPTHDYTTRPYPTRPYPTHDYTTRPYPTRPYPTRPYPTHYYTTRLYPTRPYKTTTYPPWTTAPPTIGVSVCVRYLSDFQTSSNIFTLSPASRNPLSLSVSGPISYLLYTGYSRLYFTPTLRFWSDIGSEIWSKVCITVDTKKNVVQLFSGSKMSIRKILPYQYVWSGEPMIEFSGFEGQVTDIQIWDYPLSYKEIFNYMTRGHYGSYEGSVLTWSDVSYSATGKMLFEDSYELLGKQSISKKYRERRRKAEKKRWKLLNESPSKEGRF